MFPVVVVVVYHDQGHLELDRDPLQRGVDVCPDGLCDKASRASRDVR